VLAKFLLPDGQGQRRRKRKKKRERKKKGSSENSTNGTFTLPYREGSKKNGEASLEKKGIGNERLPTSWRFSLSLPWLRDEKKKRGKVTRKGGGRE